MLINATYFNGDINIPNSDTEAVIQNIGYFISKYEPDLFIKALGYSFWKAFSEGVQVVAPTEIEQRWIDLLYGKEYIGVYGLNKWRGLIETAAPVYSFGSGLQYRRPELIRAGYTDGFTADVDTALFDGTNDAPDYRGWVLIIERIGQGTMKVNIDYTWDAVTGEMVLLGDGDTFQNGEYFFVQFQLVQEDSTPVTYYPLQRSIVAYYVYYWYMRNLATQSTGVGEVETKPAGAEIATPVYKQSHAWNTTVEWLHELYHYLEAETATYPEYDSNILKAALGFRCSPVRWNYYNWNHQYENANYFTLTNTFNI